jgi:hypothetical protein
MAIVFKAAVTIDHTKIPGDFVDFQFLFKGTYPILRTVAHGGRVPSIRTVGFYADEALTTPLKFDRKLYTESSGEVIYWVLLPNADSTTDTVIYLACDSSVSVDPNAPNDVWPKYNVGGLGWRLRTHLDLLDTLKDSTVFAHDATAFGAPPAIAGKIGSAKSFNGINQYLTVDGTFLQVTGVISMKAWVYPTSISVAQTIIHRHVNFLNYRMGVRATGKLYGGANIRDFAAAESIASLTLNAWNLVEAGYDGSVNFVVLNDVRTDSASGGGGYTGSGPTYIGCGEDFLLGPGAFPFEFFNGYIDEVDIRTIPWTQDRSTAEYNNQSSPSTFYSVETLTTRFAPSLRGQEGPLYWSTLAHRDTDGTPKRFPWAPISIADPADYQDGFKDAILLSVGEMAFPLSDRNGLLQVPTCDVTYSDLPGASGLMQLRGMLGRDTQKALRGKEFTISCITDRDRRALLAPIIAFRGFVDRCSGEPDYQFTIHAKGWIAKRLEKKLWTDRIVDLFPEAPADSLERAAPIAFGILSDEGSDAGPIVFVDDEAGRGGNGGYPNPRSSYGDLPVAAPTGMVAAEAVGLGNINLGDNPGDAYYIMATRVVAGVEGDPDTFWPYDITPVVITADSAAIDASCANDGADAYRFYIGRIFTGELAFSHYLETADPVTGVRFTDFPTLASQSLTPITAGGTLASNPFAYVSVAAVMTDGSRTQLFPSPAFPVLGVVNSLGYDRPVRFAITPLAGVDFYEFYFRRHPTNPFDKRFIVPTTQVNGNGDVYWEYDWSSSGYEVITGAPVASGVIPPVHCGKFTDLGGFSDWDGWLVSARPCWEYVAAYQNGVRVGEDEYGVDILAPGKPGYTTAFGALPFTVNGYTPTMVFTRGPRTSRILGIDGFDQETFRVNVKGHANVAGDDVETSIYELLRMLAKNAVLPDAPSIKGDFDQEPVFTDGTPRLDDDSVDQAAQDALAVIPNGPAAARWLPGDPTVDEFFQDIGPSGKMKFSIKPNGQMVVAVHNPDADPVATFDERFDIVDKAFRFDVTDQGFANATPHQYAAEYDESGNLVFQTGVPAEDAVSQSAEQYDERKPDDLWSFSWRRSAGLARGVARAFLAESKFMPQPAEADAMLHAIHRAPGEVVAVTHRQGATATGYSLRKHAVLGMRIALARYTVGFTLLDLGVQVGDLSFYQYEDFMAQSYIGGSRHDTCLTDSGIVVPFNWREFVIDWDEIPGTHGQRARILSATAAGTIKPSIFLAGEDPSGDTSVVEGITNATAVFDEQLLVIPRGDGEVRYWMLPIAAGGAAAADLKIYGFLEGYRL